MAESFTKKKVARYASFLCISLMGLANTGHASSSLEVISQKSDGSSLSGENANTIGSPFMGGQRYVIFNSWATDLIENDTNNTGDAFVYDRRTMRSVRASLAADGTELHNYSLPRAISDDARYVLFESSADNVVADDHNGQWDVFLRDTHENTTVRISRGRDGGDTNGWSREARMTPDARYIVFSSNAGNLIGNDPSPQTADIYLYDRELDQMEIIDKTTELAALEPVAGYYSDGTPAYDAGYTPIVSADGSHVAFKYNEQIYVRNRHRNTTQRVSVNNHGERANHTTFPSDISGNGRYVVFYTFANNLAAGDSNHINNRLPNDKWGTDVFVRDLDRQRTIRVSVTATGAEANGSSSLGSISKDGRYIAFISRANNLDPNYAVTTDYTQIYLKDLSNGAVKLVSVREMDNAIGDSMSSNPVLSADGRFLLFSSAASNLIDGKQLFGGRKVFLYDNGSDNQAPIADAGSDVTSFIGETVTLDAGASSDPDGDSLSYSWTLLDPNGNNISDRLNNAGSATPSFPISEHGSYSATLIVNDGELDSEAATTSINIINRPPLAIAGTDHVIHAGDTITLDGSNSSDPDNDPLTFTWSLFDSKGTDLSHLLSDRSSAVTMFNTTTIDNFTAELAVSDGITESSDTVTIRATNQAPVADAGNDLNGYLGDTITLDGGNSSDGDNDTLSFMWTLQDPQGADVSHLLSKRDQANTSFRAAAFGSYSATLQVNDGFTNSADSVNVAINNRIPIADAGADQTVHISNRVTLDGGASSDPDLQHGSSSPLTYQWRLTRPDGSDGSSDLSSTSIAAPSFTASMIGAYTATLVVNDAMDNSPADSVTIHSDNQAPTADAGNNNSVYDGETIQLNGANSSDSDGDPITFKWAITSAPQNSDAVLSGATGTNPTFVSNVAGSYTISLIVNDGYTDSAEDQVVLNIISRTATAASMAQQLLQVLNDPTQVNPATDLANKNYVKTLTNKVNDLITVLHNNDRLTAIDSIRDDMMQKTDGCSLRGTADGPGGNVRDWLTSCRAQGAVYPLLEKMLHILK